MPAEHHGFRTGGAALLERLGLLVLVAASLLLSGCAAFAPPKPYATEAEALGARGEPASRWPREQGGSVLEYPTQPYGTSCLMVEVDASGRVVRQWDALAPDNLARVQRGMDTGEVRRLLGQYRSIQRFALSGEEVWDWNIPKYAPDLLASRFNVHFIDGKVARTSVSHEYPRDGWTFGFGIGRGVGPHWGLGWRYPFGHPRYDPFWGW